MEIDKKIFKGKREGEDSQNIEIGGEKKVAISKRLGDRPSHVLKFRAPKWEIEQKQIQK